MDDLAIGAVAAFFAGMGVLGLVWPQQVVGRFGTRVDSVDGRNEVRAVYGGFGIAVGVLLAVTIGTHGGFRDGVLGAIAVSLVGMATGRLVSAVLERPDRRSPTWLFLVVELVLAGLLVVGLE
jgi:hypothetical protein